MWSRLDWRGVPGFSLVELSVVILVFGLVLGFTVPAFMNILGSYQLKGAAENITGQLRLSRQKAIGTGRSQLWHFWASTNSYHVHDLITGEVFGPWRMPRRTVLIGDNSIILQSNGCASTSADIVVQDLRGHRDTVTVQVSGMIAAY